MVIKTLAIVLLGALFPLALAEGFVCSVSQNGTLTSATQEQVTLTLPCKYRLADVTCGNYKVKVTAGNGPFLADARFLPLTLYIKVGKTDSDDFLLVRTSLARLKKLLKEKVDKIWDSKEGSLSDLDVMTYDAALRSIVIKKNDIFEVTFSADGDVEVKCLASEFVSKPVPDTLCGDGRTAEALKGGFEEMFAGNLAATMKDYVNFLTLTDKSVTQSRTCKDLANKFQSCEKKMDALTQCDVILYDASYVNCLAESATPMEKFYGDCMRSVCDDDASALEEMNAFISEHCEGVTSVGQITYQAESIAGFGDMMPGIPAIPAIPADF